MQAKEAAAERRTEKKQRTFSSFVCLVCVANICNFVRMLAAEKQRKFAVVFVFLIKILLGCNFYHLKTQVYVFFVFFKKRFYFCM
jgi:hypothetical protein